MLKKILLLFVKNKLFVVFLVLFICALSLWAEEKNINLNLTLSQQKALVIFMNQTNVKGEQAESFIKIREKILDSIRQIEQDNKNIKDIKEMSEKKSVLKVKDFEQKFLQDITLNSTIRGIDAPFVAQLLKTLGVEEKIN